MTTTTAQRKRAATTRTEKESETALDRRRDKHQHTAEAAADADRKVAALDARLAENATQHDTQQAGLQATIDQQTALKRALKVSDKQRRTLTAARKAARHDATKSHQRAVAAEAKYEAALLDDLLRQRKRTDLDAHRGPADTSATPAAEATPTTNSATTPAKATPERAVATKTAAPRARNTTTRRAPGKAATTAATSPATTPATSTKRESARPRSTT